MNSSRRHAMTECPNCGSMTDAVLECPRCGAEGCKDVECIMRAGRTKPCTDCRDQLIEEGSDDSGAEHVLSDDDEDDD